MKCFKHNTTEAVAICACCGRALGHDFIQSSSGPWFVCSGECAEALSRDSQAIQTILQQAMRSAKASAFYCHLCAGLSAGGALVAWFMLPSPFLILFTAGCAVTLLVSGIWYSLSARKRAS